MELKLVGSQSFPQPSRLGELDYFERGSGDVILDAWFGGSWTSTIRSNGRVLTVPLCKSFCTFVGTRRSLYG